MEIPIWWDNTKLDRRCPATWAFRSPKMFGRSAHSRWTKVSNWHDEAPQWARRARPVQWENHHSKVKTEVSIQCHICIYTHTCAMYTYIYIYTHNFTDICIYYIIYIHAVFSADARFGGYIPFFRIWFFLHAAAPFYSTVFPHPAVTAPGFSPVLWDWWHLLADGDTKGMSWRCRCETPATCCYQTCCVPKIRCGGNSSKNAYTCTYV